MQIYEILWLSGLLVAVSGLFLIGGYLEHKKSLLVLENLAYILFKIQPDMDAAWREKHERTDAD